MFDISDLAASQLIFNGQQVVQAADRGSGKGHHARSQGGTRRAHRYALLPLIFCQFPALVSGTRYVLKQVLGTTCDQ